MHQSLVSATPLVERTNSPPDTEHLSKGREEGQEQEAVVAFLMASRMQQQHGCETASSETAAASSEDDSSENAGEEGVNLLLAFQFQQDGGFPRAAEFEPMPRRPCRATPPRAQKRRGVADRASRFACNFPGCGKAYGCPDAVRKHCRKKHSEWLRSLGSVGPAGYCSWTSGA